MFLLLQVSMAPGWSLPGSKRQGEVSEQVRVAARWVERWVRVGGMSESAIQERAGWVFTVAGSSCFSGTKMLMFQLRESNARKLIANIIFLSICGLNQSHTVPRARRRRRFVVFINSLTLVRTQRYPERHTTSRQRYPEHHTDVTSTLPRASHDVTHRQQAGACAF